MLAEVLRDPEPQLVMEASPQSRRDWFEEVWKFRQVLVSLARADFQARYKRTTFGIAWAVAVPVLQAAIIAAVFSRVLRLSSTRDFGAYVLGGMLCWSYFSLTLASASTAIVDGAALTDKVWFPRALLPAMPPLANLPGLLVSMAALVVALPFLGSGITPRLLLLPLACLLLVVFTTSLAFVLSALHVYFRDVRYLVQAALLAWFYVTPVAYPQKLLGNAALLLDLNPLTGVVTMFRLATVGASNWELPVAVMAVAIGLLLVAGAEIQRRQDRLFVDLL
ncbi:MAG: ABC transporter permease [Candidatus Dormibacteraeota bacterium]|nr:ABC transporter permease [Candidatus Dormibacteraeota bacterium]